MEKKQKKYIMEKKGKLFEDAVKELDDFFIKSDAKNIYKFVLTIVEKPLIENLLRKHEGNRPRFFIRKICPKGRLIKS